MRIMIKGGVWKNTEDEILKAAVMKYGLNQWARISSLLVRKSAKQCKARWYEWLDPSIKKTEWTREEDEKLLHLAKLMPTQWRTIAPIVGRTPSQCLERYEKLLDAAAAKDDSYDPADDPRRLRPGEIDPNPEAKPARPDPFDMDEDEKEMLSEARARLANTRGKKAKRKAREKQLEEARRLASLQKKRELKAAGIELRQGSKKSRGIDYNKEVAFEKRPAAGFFDTGAEQDMTREMGKEFRPVTLEEMEGRRRKDIEKTLMKRDQERDERKKATNQPAAVAAGLLMNDSSANRRRGRMMLPAPQVSEAELEAIARGNGSGLDPELADGAGGAATQRLLGDYETPARFATPMRTPRVVSANGMDRITMEAQNLARLQSGQTPLMGGENPELHNSDFSGVTPRNHIQATPNPLATPAHLPGGQTPGPGMTGRAIAGISATPGRAVAGTPLRSGPGGLGATPARTPARDALGLNEDMDVESESKRDARRRHEALREDLRSGLAGLPKPENEYEITLPELPEEEADAAMEEDAADIAARKRQAAAEREAAELKKRSQVLQRGLPRPEVLTMLPEPQPSLDGKPPEEVAETLLQAEMLALIRHEAEKYPVKARKKDKKRRREETPAGASNAWEEFETKELEAARSLLGEDLKAVNEAMGHTGEVDEEYVEAWKVAVNDMIYLPSQGRYGRGASATNSDKVESLQSEHSAVVREMQKEAERALKLDTKINILTAGYQDRHKKLSAAITQAWTAVSDARTQLASFRKLAEQEERTLPGRMSAANTRLERQKMREEELQERYKQLLGVRDDLKAGVKPAVVV